jgi:hypothetical protein
MVNHRRNKESVWGFEGMYFRHCVAIHDQSEDKLQQCQIGQAPDINSVVRT